MIGKPSINYTSIHTRNNLARVLIGWPTGSGVRTQVKAHIPYRNKWVRAPALISTKEMMALVMGLGTHGGDLN